MKKRAAVLAGFALILVLSLFLGRYPKPGFAAPGTFLTDNTFQTIILSLRLPRIIMALLLGAALGAGGLVMQTVMVNPLVEPGFLGVTQGAAFGAALSIVLWGSGLLATQAAAMFFALLGLFASYWIAKRIKFGSWIIRLVLAGIILSALYSAGIGILKAIADPLNQLQEITFWMMGGLWGVSWLDTAWVSVVVVPAVTILMLFRWRINLLVLDDRMAFSLGTKPERFKVLLLLLSVLAVAAVTAVCGIVGWMGLIAPHLSRKLFGADVRRSLPGSILIGAAGTLLCDDFGRTLLENEIPIGIVTSVMGAVVFLFIMTRQARIRNA
ncbi:MAG: iron ABC transporter permease [Spirochaetales bacterium]|nr:MAG: iron ABC transporter permease [Spirochaetales bacterium]